MIFIDGRQAQHIRKIKFPDQTVVLRMAYILGYQMAAFGSQSIEAAFDRDLAGASLKPIIDT